jgi:hypothetical protein
MVVIKRKMQQVGMAGPIIAKNAWKMKPWWAGRMMSFTATGLLRLGVGWGEGMGHEVTAGAERHRKQRIHWRWLVFLTCFRTGYCGGSSRTRRGGGGTHRRG